MSYRIEDVRDSDRRRPSAGAGGRGRGLHGQFAEPRRPVRLGAALSWTTTRPRCRHSATTSRRSTSTPRRRTPTRRRASSTRRRSVSCRTSTRSSSSTGRRLHPAGRDESNPRHLSTPTTQSGSFTLATWAHKAMIAMRDYLNEGGKLIVGGRNAHEWPIGSTSLSATGPYQWAPDKVFGLLLSGRQRRRRRPAGHGVPALPRHLQRHLAELPRRRRPRDRRHPGDLDGLRQHGARRRGDDGQGGRHLRGDDAVHARHRGRRRPERGLRRRPGAAGEVAHAAAQLDRSRSRSHCARSASSSTSRRRRPRRAARRSRRPTP